jgi:hypothetical protein
MTDQEKTENPACQKTEENPPTNGKSSSHQCVGAEGYGLNKLQQEAIANLWRWQEESLSCDIILGGPIA